MSVSLKRATGSDCPKIHEIQVKAFAPLLEKYQDVETSPAAESLERIYQRFSQLFTHYYLICLDNAPIGMVRVCDFGDTCRISPIGILPEFQGRGFAQQTMLTIESLYPEAKKWTLDTISQEPKLRRLYEKLGYRETGKYENIKDGMDIVFYEKEVS